MPERKKNANAQCRTNHGSAFQQIDNHNEELTNLLRKRQKQPPAPDTFNLHQIEAWASMVGNEIHFDQRRIIVTRKIAEYAPCPQAGPGQWRETYRDNLVEAALWAASINSITASMLRALQAIDLKTTRAIKKLRPRVHGTSASNE
jgi:hypothetical protein